MLYLSEILIQNPQLETFSELKEVLSDRARQGEMFFRMDVRPQFHDTPESWEDQLEAVFTSVR